jgi:hypothetical protein
LLVLYATSLRNGDMPWPPVAVAVVWLLVVLPLYDRHRWPARVFLILTAIAVPCVFLMVAWAGITRADYLSAPAALLMLEAGFWLLAGFVLAFTRLLLLFATLGKLWYERHPVA